MEIREADGRHLPSMTAEERLREIVEEFNSSAGLQAKHKMDEDRFRAMLNIIGGTTVALCFKICTLWFYLLAL